MVSGGVIVAKESTHPKDIQRQEEIMKQLEKAIEEGEICYYPKFNNQTVLHRAVFLHPKTERMKRMAFTREFVRTAAKQSGVELPKELEDAVDARAYL